MDQNTSEADMIHFEAMNTDHDNIPSSSAPTVSDDYPLPQIEDIISISMVSTDNTTTADACDGEKSVELISLNKETIEESTILDENVINSEQTTTSAKTSRELKLLLELSKEANLDTNIIHKRKSLDSKVDYSAFHKTGSSTLVMGESRDQGKRSMRSQNPEFVAKHHKTPSKDNDSPSEQEDKPKDKLTKRSINILTENAVEGVAEESLKKIKKTLKSGKDAFCWRCHREGIQISCETCVRSYHLKCLKANVVNPDKWPCPECVAILRAESTKTRSKALKDMSLEQICGLLKFAHKRMMQCNDAEPFMHPVNEKEFPDYKTYIIYPMDLMKLDDNIKHNLYGSTTAFEADAKWILHNSIIFNSYQAKVTSIAKTIVKVCKQEMQEIENCPNCYLNANTKKNWFVEVCPKPHLLLWAKLKGFPYWPAKAMSTNTSGMVDVRFFGAHDRAWVPVKECFLFSRKDPNSNKQKRNDINECIKELEVHIERLKDVYGEFDYAPYRTPYDPSLDTKQLQIFLPKYKPDEKIPPLKINLESIRNIEKSGDTSSDTSKGDISESLNPSRTSSPSRSKHKEYSNSDSSSNSKPNFSQGYETDEDSSLMDIPHDSDIEDEEEISLKLDASEEFDTQFEYGTSTSPHSKTESTKDSPIKSPENIKSPKSSIEMSTRKRSSSEELCNSSKKLSRRNSDQSTKSDSSRMSNLSDKINKVDISENMEIALGNDEVGNISIVENTTEDVDSTSLNFLEISEPKKKPVQVNVENEELMISPQNKCSIADRLIKKLSGESDCKTSTPVQLANIKKQIFDKMSVSASSTSSDEIETEIKPTSSSASNELTIKEPSIALMNSIESQNANNNISECNTDIEEETSQVDKNPIETSVQAKVDEENDEETLENDNENIQEDEIVEEEISQNSPPHSPNTNFIEKISTLYTQIEITPSRSKIDHAKSKFDLNISDESNLNFIESEPNVKESKPTLSPLYKKRKFSSDNEEPSMKLIKVRDINSIRDKSHVNLINEKTESQKYTLKVNDNKSPPSIKSNSSSPKSLASSSKTSETSDEGVGCSQSKVASVGSEVDLCSVEIKTEVVSDNEDEEYILKKQFFSSLNIGEKTSHVEKPRQKEIQTRSKTEERIKFKNKSTENITEALQINKEFRVVDNITRVIDAVASSYSQEHEGEEITIKKPEPTKKEGNIKVLTFHSNLPKQKSKKPFVKTPIIQVKKVLPRPDDVKSQSSSKPISIGTVKTYSSIINTGTTNRTTTVQAGNLMLIAPSSVSLAVLPPNQTIYHSANIGNSLLTMVQPTTISNANQQDENESQNYIPQNGATVSLLRTNKTSNSVNGTGKGCTINGSSSVKITEVSSSSQPMEQDAMSEPVASTSTTEFEHLNKLADVVPESVSRAITEILCRGPPKLKPRPPGPLSMHFDEGLPSSAGSVTCKVNSMAHRLNDYFRGMMIETLQEIGTDDNPEAAITNLKLELETLKHKHNEEILEIKRNLNAVVKDIQKSMLEEKQRVIDDTRATCEAETIRRVQETKTKQWCANCFKEAYFFCCWNTSYCDFNCQKTHWTKHSADCQNTSSSQTQNTIVKTGQPILIRQSGATSKGFTQKTLITKPTKFIYRNPTGVPVSYVKNSAGNHLTIVESTPGKFELVGNGPIAVGGKIVANSSKIISKIKPGNIITVSSPSSCGASNTQQTFVITQTKPAILPNKTTSTTSTLNNEEVSEVLSD